MSNFSFCQCFSTCLVNFLPFSLSLKLSSANSLSLEESKICRLVMKSEEPMHGLIKIIIQDAIQFGNESSFNDCLI